MHSYHQSGFRRRRRGIQVLEVLVLFPILLIATFSFFVLGPAVTIRQNVQNAAEEAAREVAKKTGTQTTTLITTDVVNEILAVHGMLLGNTSGALVYVEEFGQPVTCIGDMTVATCPAASSVTIADQVLVTVVVSMDDAPIPNVLSGMGFDVSGRTISHTAIAFRDD